MNIITIMLDYEFMRTAFAAAAVVALLAGPVGYFLVLRGQTFAGHALAHVGFTGATGAVLLGLAPLYGLFFLTVLAGLAMGAFGEKLANRDVAIGLVLALALGIGLLFLHFFTGFATQATALLFGNILAVSKQTLMTLVIVSVACVLVLAAISRPLLFASLQPELAEAKGVHARTISTMFLVIVAVTTAGASQIVGVLLVFALMVGPAAAAQRLTLGVLSGLVVSALLALTEAWGGLALAYLTDWPTSFWITALSVAVYMASLALPKAVHN